MKAEAGGIKGKREDERGRGQGQREGNCTLKGSPRGTDKVLNSEGISGRGAAFM